MWPLVLPFLRSRIGLYAIAAVAVVAAVWWYGHQQYRAGYLAHETEVARAAAKAERERKNDDARLQGLSDYDLCREYLGARGLPVTGCDELRRVPAE